MSDQPSKEPSIAQIVIQQYDTKLLDHIGTGSEKLTRAIPPDARLHVLEELAHDYTVLATMYAGRAHYILRIIEQDGSWRTRRIQKENLVIQEFANFGEYRRWFMINVIKKASEATYFNYKDLMDRLEGMNFDQETILELMENPSRTRTAMELIKFDGAKRFEGIERGADGDVLKRMMREVGYESVEGKDIDIGEIAREYVNMAATSDDDTRAIVNRVAGGWYSDWNYFDDKKGGGPRIMISGWSSQKRSRYEHIFFLSKGEELHPQAVLWLKKHYHRSYGQRTDQKR